VNCVLVVFKKSVISIDPACKVTCAVPCPLHPGRGSLPICTLCNSFSFAPNQRLEITFCQCTSVSRTFILLGLQGLLKLLCFAKPSQPEPVLSICIIPFHAFYQISKPVKTPAPLNLPLISFNVQIPKRPKSSV
jgi:hypothetical protein